MFYKKYLFGDTAVCYQEVPVEGHEGKTTVGLALFPVGEEKEVPMDSLIQVSFTGDETLIDYTLGVTMRNREGTLLKVEEQAAEENAERLKKALEAAALAWENSWKEQGFDTEEACLQARASVADMEAWKRTRAAYDQELLRSRARGIPAVLLGDVMPELSGRRINAVSTDNYVGGAMAASYLRRLGHRQILYLGPRRDSVTQTLRLRGFLDTAGRCGMEVETVYNPGGVSSAASGYQLARKALAGPLPQTAVFAPSDAMALGVLQAADELGVDVPGRISLLGYDDIEYASLPKIRLSTLAQPTDALAENAVRLLLDLVDSNGPESYTHRLISPRLVERSTCRPLPSAGQSFTE